MSEPGSGRPTYLVWLTRLAALAFVAAALLLAGILFGFLDTGPAQAKPSVNPIPAQYDADRAFGYLKQLCDIGRRPTGSPGMREQQELLQQFFTERGAEVRLQEHRIRHPQSGDPVTVANLIATWYPDRPKRYLLCAHYDTRPFPDLDRRNRKGTFVGANDGASGTAALMELAHHLDQLPDDIGVDIVLFDAEEFVFEEGRDDYFVGSSYFAYQYRVNRPEVPYTAGILLDMVGDKELALLYEPISMRYARDVATSVWNTASELGVRAFIRRVRSQQIRDDHVPLNEIARIPTIDIIDFDYPRPGLGAPQYWHTEQDVPANCSGESLAAVVWVVHQWLMKQGSR